MGVAHAFRRYAGNEIVHCLVGQHARLGIEERHVDERALPRCIAAAQGRERCDDGIDAREDVGERDADLLRLAIRQSRQVHDAAEALDHEIVAGPARIGAVLAEAADRAVDQAWTGRTQALLVEAVALQSSDLEILDEDIGARSEALDETAVALVGKVRRHRTLAPVAAMKVGGRKRAAVLSFNEGRSPGAGVVAALRMLDLDDVGAEIGEDLAGPGSGKNASKHKDADAVERREHAEPETGRAALCKPGLAGARPQKE